MYLNQSFERSGFKNHGKVDNHLKIEKNRKISMPPIKDKEIESVKTDSKSIESKIDKFHTLIKNINNTSAFNDIAMRAIKKQSKNLTQIREYIANIDLFDASNEILQLTKEIEVIAQSTKFNNKPLLNGDFKNENFAFSIGEESSQYLDINIDSTNICDIGKVRYETTEQIEESSTIDIKIYNDNSNLELSGIKIGYKEGEGLGYLTSLINENSLDFNASYSLISTGFKEIEQGVVENLKINDISIGTVEVESLDANLNLITTINFYSSETGVRAYLDSENRLNLESIDGRGMKIEADSGLSTVTNIHENLAQSVSIRGDQKVDRDLLINSGFQINGTVINSEDVTVIEFIELINSSFVGLKASLDSDDIITFYSKNVENMSSKNINFSFSSIDDIFTLGFIQTMQESSFFNIFDENTSYSIEAKDYYAESFENYGKLTINSENDSDIEFEIEGSYLFKNAVENQNMKQTTLSLSNLKDGFNENEIDAIGVFANKFIKESEKDNLNLINLTRTIETILKVSEKNLENTFSNLNNIKNILNIGVSSSESYVEELLSEKFKMKDFIDMKEQIAKKNLIVPALGYGYGNEMKIELEDKLMTLLFFDFIK